MLTSKMRRVVPTSSWVIFKRIVRLFTRAPSSELGLHLLLPLPAHHCFINPTSHVQNLLRMNALLLSHLTNFIQFPSPSHLPLQFPNSNTYNNTSFGHQETIKLSSVFESPHTAPPVINQIHIILLSSSLRSIKIL